MENSWLISGSAIAIIVFIPVSLSCQRQPRTTSWPSAQATAPSSASSSGLPKREPIFFIKGDGTLSPGAIVKLKTWVKAWGAQGRWTLECPSGAGLSYELLEKRLLSIRTELRKCGVSKVETILLPSAPAGQYDAIYVAKEPSS